MTLRAAGSSCLVSALIVGSSEACVEQASPPDAALPLSEGGRVGAECEMGCSLTFWGREIVLTLIRRAAAARRILVSAIRASMQHTLRMLQFSCRPYEQLAQACPRRLSYRGQSCHQLTRVQDKTHWRRGICGGAAVIPEQHPWVIPNGDTFESTYASDDAHAIDHQVENVSSSGVLSFTVLIVQKEQPGPEVPLGLHDGAQHLYTPARDAELWQSAAVRSVMECPTRLGRVERCQRRSARDATHH